MLPFTTPNLGTVSIVSKVKGLGFGGAEPTGANLATAAAAMHTISVRAGFVSSVIVTGLSLLTAPSISGLGDDACSEESAGTELRRDGPASTSALNVDCRNRFFGITTGLRLAAALVTSPTVNELPVAACRAELGCASLAWRVCAGCGLDAGFAATIGSKIEGRGDSRLSLVFSIGSSFGGAIAGNSGSTGLSRVGAPSIVVFNADFAVGRTATAAIGGGLSKTSAISDDSPRRTFAISSVDKSDATELSREGPPSINVLNVDFLFGWLATAGAGESLPAAPAISAAISDPVLGTSLNNGTRLLLVAVWAFPVSLNDAATGGEPVSGLLNG